MKISILNFKQLSTLLFVSIILCGGNLFYSKNLAADFDEREFIEQEGLEDSIIVSNTENNVVYARYKNVIHYTNINSKNLKIKCENCTVELLKPGKLELVASLSKERTCNLIFIDSVKNIILDKLQFKIYPLPNPKLLLGGVESGGDIDKVNSLELKVSPPDSLISTRVYEILHFRVNAIGNVFGGNGNLKDCNECTDFIKTLHKGTRLTIFVTYSNGYSAHTIAGTWVKIF